MQCNQFDMGLFLLTFNVVLCNWEPRKQNVYAKIDRQQNKGLLQNSLL